KDLEQTIQNQSDDNDNNIANTAKINKALVRLFVYCGNYLDAEIANITLKVEEELRFLKNLTLG
ncbi:1340_t:CDS:2, partial [Funneliformis geosporum]